MQSRDARSLPSAAQEALRLRVVQAVENGMMQTEAAQVFGVARGTISGWRKRLRSQGPDALKARKRGRPSGTRLSSRQEKGAVQAIVGRCPDQLRLPFALWTREAVQMLLVQRYGVRVSVWTVGRYLRRWGLTPQKPLNRAFEQDPEGVRRWLEEEYPAIERLAKAHGARIYWGDEMGLRSDHQAGRTWGLKGKTPVVHRTGKRFGCNMISAITNRGRMAFMVFTGRFNAAVFLKFLQRLLRHHGRGKIFFIVDKHPAHTAAAVRRWVDEQGGRIQIFFLPSYSPELNPDECLNQDVKSNAVGRQRPRDLGEMLSTVRSYLWATQRRPRLVRNFFNERHVTYAAA